MKDTSVKTSVKDFFKNHGIQVEDIPEGKTETADLMVTMDNDIFFVEIKSRLDDQKKIKEENERLSKGEMISRYDTTGRKDQISNIAKKAASQLNEHDGQGIKLLWFVGLGNDGKLQSDQCRATLYGIVDVGEREFPEKGTKDCYYFDHGDFYKFRDILDGAVVGHVASDGVYYGGLNINNFSEKKALLINSKITKLFGAGICNPDDLEARGQIYIADCPIQRSDKLGVLEYVQEKYGLGGLYHITFQSHELVAQLAFKGLFKANDAKRGVRRQLRLESIA
jgi:hypothetical protein